MNILIWDQEERHARQIKEFCLKYAIQRNLEFQVFLPDDYEDFNRIVEHQDVLGVFFLETGEHLGEIAGQIRKNGEEHYIVLLGNQMTDLITGITPITRPAGCLLKPAQEQKVLEILEAIWKDSGENQSGKGMFHFQIQSTTYAIPYEKILFFESARKKIILQTQAQEFEFYSTMSEIEEELPDHFMRVHKSFIVNLDMIERVDFPEMTIYLEGDTFVYLSRSYKKELQERMKGGGPS